MRSFVAIDIGQAIRDRLAELSSSIRGSGAGGRPANPASIHLTLKFLGEIEPGQVAGILAALESTASGFEPFSLEARSLGVFPDLERPRILWAGLTPTETVRSLQANLEGQLEALGFAREGRPFHPHLTLLRIRKLENRQTFARFIQRHSGVSFGDLRVAELVLFESLLKPQGAEYNVLGRAELRSGPK